MAEPPVFDLATYYPIFIYLVVLVGFAIVTLIMAHIIGPHRRSAVKSMPYESGMDPIGDARQRFDVKFYLVAILFLVFDVELLFLYPWAVIAYARRAGSVSYQRAGSLASGVCCRLGPVFWSVLVFHRAAGGGLRLCLAERGVPMALDLPENVVVTKLDQLANWCRKNSLWPMPFATACCGIELMATGASRHDIARFGAEVMRFSPRQCDLMIVAGRVVMKMLPVLQRIWLQMPEPKWCISMGACCSSGGVFDTYAVVQGIDRFIPVDMYVPGCPPRPEQLIQSVIDLQDKIQKTGTLQRARSSPRATVHEGPSPNGRRSRRSRRRSIATAAISPDRRRGCRT